MQALKTDRQRKFQEFSVVPQRARAAGWVYEDPYIFFAFCSPYCAGPLPMDLEEGRPHNDQQRVEWYPGVVVRVEVDQHLLPSRDAAVRRGTARHVQTAFQPL